MNPVTSNLISASAGTGKTYKLASRFISLLALGYPAERLIALTFTRNAAGEFKSNILKALAKGAATPEGAAELTARITATLNGSHEGDVPLCPYGADIPGLQLGREKYRDLLSKMIHRLARLNLSTLDSFFSKLVGTNCMKLGYPTVEQMDDAVEEQARKAALSALLLSDSEDEDGLPELLGDVSGESKKSFATLEENISAYYTQYKNTEANAEHVWGAVEPFGFTNPRALALVEESRHYPPSEVKEKLAQIWDASEARINELLDILQENGTRLHERKNYHDYIEKACRGLVPNLRKGDGTLNSTTLKWLYSEAPATGAAEAELRRLVGDTRDISVLLTASLKTRALLKLMRHYDRHYTQDVQASGKLVFADMPRLVADHLLNGEDLGAPANIAYRLDGQLDHWMLDEFQDTSPEQWRALKTLLQEIRDAEDRDPAHKCSERSIFVVGDEKQSIYSFRDATPELFTYLKEGENGWDILQCTRQDASFRSADAIMGAARVEEGVRYGFVNDLFMHLPTLTPKESAEFSHHNIAAVNKDKVGYTAVEKFAGEDADVLEEMCERMAAILTGETEADFLHRDISAAILVRRNSEVHSICRWFRKNCPQIPVVSLTDEKLSNSSLLGEWFLHFFKWMQHPCNTFSESMLLHSPLCVRETPEESPGRAWRRWRNMLDSKGYVATMTTLAGGNARVLRDRAFREWMNEARAFDSAGKSLDNWLLYMSNLTNKAAAPKSSVHVMTIHKSKGLGYDVVLMPFSSSSSAVTPRTNYYTEVAGVQDRKETVGLLVNPGVRDDGIPASPYQQLVSRKKREQALEALNMLYVAVTRAKLANYILINLKEKKKEKESDSLSLSIPEMINFAFESVFTDNKVEWGRPDWAAYTAPKEPETAEAATIQAPARTYRRRVSPSKIDDTYVSVEPLIPAAAEQTPAHASEYGVDAADFGTAVHALFEQVLWLEQEPGWMLRPSSAEQRLVAAALRVPEIRQLYTQQPGQVPYNEQPIDAIERRKGRAGTEKELWISGTLDRLVLTYRGGSVVAADIIDFKTDLRKGATPAEQDAHLCDTHRPQMRAYHSLISRAFGLPPQAVRVTLISCPRDFAPARPVPCPL